MRISSFSGLRRRALGVIAAAPGTDAGPSPIGGQEHTSRHQTFERTVLPIVGRSGVYPKWWASSRSDVFDQEHERQVVYGGRFEPPVAVEAGCSRVLGMDEYQTESGQVGYLERFEQKVFEQRRGEACSHESGPTSKPRHPSPLEIGAQLDRTGPNGRRLSLAWTRGCDQG